MLKAAPNQTVFPTVDSSAFILSGAGIITEAGTTRTLSAADNGKVIYCTSGSAVTITCAAGLGAGVGVGTAQEMAPDSPLATMIGAAIGSTGGHTARQCRADGRLDDTRIESASTHYTARQ